LPSLVDPQRDPKKFGIKKDTLRGDNPLQRSGLTIRRIV